MSSTQRPRRARNGSPDGAVGGVLSPETVDDDVTVRGIYGRHYLELRNYAWSMVGNREDAEDIVQQAFANTIAAVKGGAVVDETLAWLYRCVRNLALDRNRDDPNHRPLERALDVAAHRTAEEVAEVGRRCRAATGAMRGLPDHLREVFVLAEIRGMSYREIAQRTERSVGSIRHLLFRARNEVRDSVRREGVVVAGPLAAWHALVAARPVVRLRAGLAARSEQLQSWLAGVGGQLGEAAAKPALVVTLIVTGLVSAGVGIVGSPGLGGSAPGTRVGSGDLSTAATGDGSQSSRAGGGPGADRGGESEPSGGATLGSSAPAEPVDPHRAGGDPSRDRAKDGDSGDREDGGWGRSPAAAAASTTSVPDSPPGRLDAGVGGNTTEPIAPGDGGEPASDPRERVEDRAREYGEENGINPDHPYELAAELARAAVRRDLVPDDPVGAARENPGETRERLSRLADRLAMPDTGPVTATGSVDPPGGSEAETAEKRRVRAASVERQPAADARDAAAQVDPAR